MSKGSVQVQLGMSTFRVEAWLYRDSVAKNVNALHTNEQEVAHCWIASDISTTHRNKRRFNPENGIVVVGH